MRESKPPFKMIVETDLERWRYDSWATKEPETLSWIEGFTNGDTFYDVGSNIGLYALYCAYLHPQSLVFAFEPDYVNQLRMQQNRNMNELTNMFCLRFAISDHEATEMFFAPKTEAGSTGGMIGQPASLEGIAFSPAYRLPTAVMSIDHIVDRDMLKPPNHIKIDVDGNEEAVLAGMVRTLKRPDLLSVLIEVDYVKHITNDIIRLFKGHGFTDLTPLNNLPDHSRHRRQKENIKVENIIFVRA